MHVPIDSSPHYTDFLDSWTVLIALSNSYLNACMQCREEVCTIFIMVFGMTWPELELTSYRVRGGHANHIGVKPQGIQTGR